MATSINEINRNFITNFFSKIKFFSFIPWVTFIHHSTTHLHNRALLHIGLGENCQHIQKIFHVTLANTTLSRQKGLSGKINPLSSDKGMLFVFDKPEKNPSFWMKNTFIPLQIGFFDKDGKLVKTDEMLVEKNPFIPPSKLYDYSGIAIAVLEVAPYTLDKLSLSSTILCIEPH